MKCVWHGTISYSHLVNIISRSLTLVLLVDISVLELYCEILKRYGSVADAALGESAAFLNPIALQEADFETRSRLRGFFWPTLITTWPGTEKTFGGRALVSYFYYILGFLWNKKFPFLWRTAFGMHRYLLNNIDLTAEDGEQPRYIW